MIEYPVKEIMKGVWRIEEFNLGTMYAVKGSERGLVIDTGTGVGDFKGLVEKLLGVPYDVVLTHGHTDHVGGSHQFAKIHIHPGDTAMLSGISIESRKHYVKIIQETYPESRDLYSADNIIAENVNPEIVYIGENHVFDLGDKKLQVFCCPGHTEGSICILDREDRILFSGDNLQHLCLMMAGQDRMGIVRRWMNGVSKVYSLRSEYDTICGGHEELTADIISDLMSCGKGILDGSIIPGKKKIHIFEAYFASYGKVNILYKGLSENNRVKEYELMRPGQILEERDRFSVVYLPMGPLEWHGPAMPFGTDPLTAKAVAEAAAERTGGIVMPTLFFGTECSRDPETLKNIGFKGDEYIIGQDFPRNTLPSQYAREEIFALTVREYIRMLEKQGFKLIVLVNGHGATGQIRSLERLRDEFNGESGSHIIIPSFFLTLDEEDEVNMGHATAYETSVMMHLTESVDLNKLPDISVPLNNTDWGITDGATYAGFANKEGTVVGDPRKATAAKGKLYVEKAVEQICAVVSKEYERLK